MDPISNDQIQQYKEYYKGLNIRQMGSSVLLEALEANKKGRGLFSPLESSNLSNESNIAEQTEQSSKLNINKEAVTKKLWQELEKEILDFERKNPEVKGAYIVAINEDEGGLPKIKVSDINEVLPLIGEDEREESRELIKQHPVQIFGIDTVDIDGLSDFGDGELKSIIDEFMEKNSSVFKYLSS